MNVRLGNDDLNVINQIFGDLNLYIHNQDKLKKVISIDLPLYNDISKEAEKQGILVKKDIQSLIYICYQFQKSISTTNQNSSELISLYQNKRDTAKNYILLHEFKEKYLAKKRDNSIKFNKIIIEIEINSEKKTLEFSDPNVILNRMNIQNLEIPAHKDLYGDLIDFMDRYFKVPDSTYYRKNGAKALKAYCDKFKILTSEKGVKNPSKQMMFIYFLMHKFNIIEEDYFLPGNEVKSIISLISTPYKVRGLL